MSETRSVFMAAVLGNLAPQLLRWYIRERIDVPVATWWELGSWLVAILLFAAFAGYVAAHVWKEKTTRRAFFIGLALPYMLSGAILDLQKASQTKSARAENLLAPVGILVVEATREADGKVQKLEDLKIKIVQIEDAAKEPKPILDGYGPGPFFLPEGRYRVSVASESVAGVTLFEEVAIQPDQTSRVTLKFRRSILNEIWRGLIWAISPDIRT